MTMIESGNPIGPSRQDELDSLVKYLREVREEDAADTIESLREELAAALAAPAQTPMSEEQADALLKDQWLSNDSTWYSLIRAVEAFHGNCEVRK